MSHESTRSEQVVEDFKKRKLAISAFRKIHEIIQGFDDDRAADSRIARIGLVIIVVVVVVAAYYYLSMDSVMLSWLEPVQTWPIGSPAVHPLTI